MSSGHERLREILLNSKALPPRHPETDAVLARIMRLRLDGYREADVRAEVIDPLVRVLGYDKESHFSLEREKPVAVLGAKKQIDYSMTLFAEHFWLIEAKRPGKAKSFDRGALYQALRYAAHPDVNAALLVLCDGNKIEVFDREHDLGGPMLRVARQDLARDFDTLRSLLGPWQAFFFEKRRVLRLVDKVFDREVNLERLEEMRSAIDRRLVAKRTRVIENLRANAGADSDAASDLEYLRAADPADPAEIVEARFFVGHTAAAMDAMAANLVERCLRGSSAVIDRVFPSRPRAANGIFWVHALHALAALREAGCEGVALPSYLAGDGRGLDNGFETLARLCLTGFARDRPRQVILRYSSAARRLAKLRLVLGDRARDLGTLMHLFERHVSDEFTLRQQVSSPERHVLLALDPLEFYATSTFVGRHTDQRGTFAVKAAEQELRDAWDHEVAILGQVRDYPRLLAARGLDETFPTEAADVVYDQLGHSALCVLDRWPASKSWALAEHRRLVEDLAYMGSWMARRWLGLGDDVPSSGTERADAERFFFGRLDVARALRVGYGWAGYPDEVADPCPVVDVP